MAQKKKQPAYYIRLYARKYGVDPRAALAVARGEGGLGWGAVGDSGQSHGPFQLKVGGANPYTGAKARAFANSSAGIAYAIRKMAESGAKGKTGAAAINAIVRNFERPADPDSSVANAIARYGKGAGKGVPTPARAQPRPQLRTAAGLTPQLLQLLNQGNRAVGLPGLPAGLASRPLTVQPPRVRARTQRQQAQGQPMGRVALMIAAITQAQKLGLRASENPYVDPVDPVHTGGSFHYRTLGKHKGKSVGGGLDVSGDPQKLRAFFLWAERMKGINELFFDPAGRYWDQGQRRKGSIGGHGTHVHLGV